MVKNICATTQMKVERFELDEQQMTAVESNARNILVVAGAGTGKTTTIIGRVKYLLLHGLCKPSEILVLSYTNASAGEMRARINREIFGETGISKTYDTTKIDNSDFELIESSTFHAFGFKIIKQVERKKFSVETKSNQKRRRAILQNDRAKSVAKDPDSIQDEENIIYFDEMISRAKSYVESGKYKHKFKYVIVDEYQDISNERYEFLKALRDSGDFNLFCVGDDWQSIYGFNGGNVDLILNFEKYWGPTSVYKIEQTYRFPQKIADISSEFVMENPAQIRKKIKGLKSHGDEIFEIVGDSARQNLNFIISKLEIAPKNASIFFLGRYNSDRKVLMQTRIFRQKVKIKAVPSATAQHQDKTVHVAFKSDPHFSANTIKESQNNSYFDELVFKKRPDLKIKFFTAHRAKGLQADYVFILNLKKGSHGFPDIKNKGTEKFLYAEERRLFYVALTRAKKRVFLLTTNSKESHFIKELRNFSEMKQIKLTLPRKPTSGVLALES